MRIEVSLLDQTSIERKILRTAKCMSTKPFVVLLYTKNCGFCKRLMLKEEGGIWDDFVVKCKETGKNVLQIDVSNQQLVTMLLRAIDNMIDECEKMSRPKTKTCSNASSKRCLEIIKSLLRNINGVPSITFVSISDHSNHLNHADVVMPYEGNRTISEMMNEFSIIGSHDFSVLGRRNQKL